MTHRLLKLREAAEQLGVPMTALRNAAEKHGLLVRMGACTVRIDQDSLGGLIELCRDQPREPASRGGKTASSTSMTAPTATDASARALATAAKLKARSPTTSPPRAAPVVQLHRTK